MNSNSTKTSSSIRQPCPCGHNRTMEQCCFPYISGKALPNTAEQLMRSRYTAYTLANIDYIKATMCGPAATGFDATAAYQWAKTAKWKRLKVTEAYLDPEDSNHAFVTFSAYLIWQGKPQTLSETSEFKCIEKRWFYFDTVRK